MSIPTSSNFPNSLDTDENLYVVHDSLTLRLAEDYTPGDTSITVDSNPMVMGNFPSSGLITLTDQCSDIGLRAISFHYSSRTTTTFNGLTLKDGFTDVAKQKKITNVTMNVMDDHHNNLKEALIAVEEFIGIKGTLDSRPYGDTLEGRINFLHKVALRPHAWFSVNKRIGVIPLTVEFTDLSLRTATGCEVGTVSYVFDFGDGTTTSTSVEFPSVELDSVLSTTDLNGGIISHIYTEPGIYSPTLSIVDDFGSDAIEFPSLIHARLEAPNEATISIVPTTEQTLEDGVLRTGVNTLINIQVPSGENPDVSNRSYAGEELDDNGDPIDPIIQYTWSLTDDLEHENSRAALAAYSIGGIYDITLRTDTQFGAYRITLQTNSIDVVESSNLWLWTAPDSSSPNTVQAFEMGLISESFKVGSGQTQAINRDDSFLDSTNDEARAKREFNRNNGFASRQTIGSNKSGSSTLIYHATGRSEIESSGDEDIDLFSYNGFLDTYTSESSISRPWNWITFSSTSNAYFFLGNESGVISDNTAPTNQVRTALNLSSLASTNITFTSTDYKNGGEELQDYVASFSQDTIPDDGYFGVHRATWKGSTGYLIRNSGSGSFFRLLNFYMTEGTFADNFTQMTKLPDMLGEVKLEGQLVTLSEGVYFFDNSGTVSAYNTTSQSWHTGGIKNSASFRSFQDTSVSGYGSVENTLLATSNNDKLAYLSFDYSTSAMVKFNEVDTTFSSLVSRPSGEQWLLGVY